MTNSKFPTQSEWLKEKREKELHSPQVMNRCNARRKVEDLKILNADDYSTESELESFLKENAA